MKEILKNPNDKLICVDLDGTLSIGEFWNHDDVEPKPIQKGIDLVNKLYVQGAHIIIWSARQPEFYPETYAWLYKHNVKFHGL